MMTELYVEGQKVDVSQSFSTFITYRIDDLKNFGSKSTNFSKTLIIPGTANNNKLFGNVFATQSSNLNDPALPNILTNFNAAAEAACIIFQGNIQIFKGVFQILEVISDRGRIEYEAAVKGELGGFVAKMGNGRLEDLDFSDYDHIYNHTNVAASWDNTPGSGVYFPLIDYGGYSTDKHNWQLLTFRPAFYVKEYLDKIFAAAGYSYECPLFNTNRFKGLIIPGNQKVLSRNTGRALTASIGAGTGQLVLDILEFGKVAFHKFVGTNFTQSVDKKTFTYNGPNLTAKLDYSISGTYEVSAGASLRIFVRKNGVLFHYDDQPLLPAAAGTPFSRSHIEIPITLVATDVLDVYAELIPSAGVDTFQLKADDATFLIYGEASIAEPVAINDTIYMNDAIPRQVLQKDFVSSILKLFNLYVYEDRDEERKLNITPYVDFYQTDRTTFLDWTHKIDRSKPVRIKPMSELNSRYYEFKFKGDSDYYNDQYLKKYGQGYGSRTYDSAYDFATESNTVELIFAGTPLVGYAGEDKVYSTIFKRTGNTPADQKEETTDSVIRILQTKKITGVASWDIKNGTASLASYTSYGYAGHLDNPITPTNDIQFGAPKELFYTLTAGTLSVNQFNVYYSPYMAEITDKDSKLLNCTMRLTVADIFNLDFSRLIWIDGTLYRLVKVEDYNASTEDVCKVQLLRVIETLY